MVPIPPAQGRLELVQASEQALAWHRRPLDRGRLAVRRDPDNVMCPVV